MSKKEQKQEDPNKSVRITRWNGQTHKSTRHTPEEAAKIIERATNPETGEVRGNISDIEDINDPNNRVSTRQHELPEHLR